MSGTGNYHNRQNIRFFSILFIGFIYLSSFTTIFSMDLNKNFSSFDLNSSRIINSKDNTNPYNFQNAVSIPKFSSDIIHDNQTHSYIFLSDEYIMKNSTILNDFISNGGVLEMGPWESLHGFSGTINNSISNLGKFLLNYTNLKVYADASISAQMNSVINQLGLFDFQNNHSAYPFFGTSDASLAILDSGIDMTHSKFNPQNRKFWQDFVGNSSSPIDENGHGTAMSGILIASNSSNLDSNHTIINNSTEYSLTISKHINHTDYFYPNHIAPGIYNIKICGFELGTNASDYLNGSVSISDFQEFANYSLTIYRNGNEYWRSSNHSMQFNVDLLQGEDSPAGIYDLYFSYEITLGSNPQFNLLANMSISASPQYQGQANFPGIAPQAEYGSLRILDSNGTGHISALISALDWLAHNSTQYNITVALLSIDSNTIDSDLADKVTQLIDQIIENGTMIIIAAGNRGISGGINPFAKSKNAIIVGSINNNDQLTYYSPEGSNEENYEIPGPDIVASGGSLLPNHPTIITAETNYEDEPIDNFDLTQNDLTSLSGTSVSAAVIAGVYNLISEALGGWEKWNQTDGNTAKLVKSLLLMTATETNQQREDDPYSNYNEAQSSPTLNRGNIDLREGFGRINPSAIFQMLNTSISIGDTKNISLTSSSLNPSGIHAYALNLTLQKDQLYRFNCGIHSDSTTGQFDPDIYLYDSLINPDGIPILVASSTTAGQQNETMYFTSLNKTGSFYMVIKAISGAGNLTLNISKAEITQEPILSDAVISVLPNSDFNDTLNTYRFEVNYTQIDNFPASRLSIHFNGTSETETYDLTKIFFDSNFTDGCLYRFQKQFEFTGDYYFNFTVILGNYSINYTDSNVFHIKVNSIGNQVPFTYSTEFKDPMKVQTLWEGDRNISEYLISETSQNCSIGWNWVNISQDLEPNPHLYNSTSWQAYYCGISGKSKGDILITQSHPIYSYQNLSDTYNLITPYTFVSPELRNPSVNIGLRAGLLQGDSLRFQIRVNRSQTWTTLETLTGIDKNWFMIEFSLVDYVDDFIQMRIQTEYSAKDQYFGQGVMINYFAFKESVLGSNVHAPVIENYSVSKQNMEFAFTAAYSDEDGNYPKQFYLDIGGENDSHSYQLENIYGNWNSTPFSIDNQSTLTNSILFGIKLSLNQFENKSFRFRVFDGKFYNSTDWNSTLQSDLNQSNSIQMISNQIPWDNKHLEDFSLIDGKIHSLSPYWDTNGDSWHEIYNISNSNSNSNSNSEFYCGNSQYQGYGTDINASIVTPIIFLNSSHPIYLSFTQRLRFDTSGDKSGDSANILITTDEGKTWNKLTSYTQSTAGLNYDQIQIDLSDYMLQSIQLKFQFISDDTGTIVRNSGWHIRSISVDIDRSLDYISPVIEFENLSQGQTISGKFNVSIKCSDSSGIDTEKIQIWAGNHQLKFNFENNTLSFIINSKDFPNGEITLMVVVYDNAGNRQLETLSIKIYTPLNSWALSAIIVGSAALIGFLVFKFYRERKIRDLLATGDFIRKPNFFQRINQHRYSREKIKDEMEILINNLDPNWEKAQPMQLYCKSCKRNFISPKFDIYCPVCHSDSLVIKKYCPACKKWRIFDDESNPHKCKGCGLLLLKDFKTAEKELRNPESTAFRKRTISDEDLIILKEIANRIPHERLQEIFDDIVKKEESELTGDFAK